MGTKYKEPLNVLIFTKIPPARMSGGGIGLSGSTHYVISVANWELKVASGWSPCLDSTVAVRLRTHHQLIQHDHSAPLSIIFGIVCQDVKLQLAVIRAIPSFRVNYFILFLSSIVPSHTRSFYWFFSHLFIYFFILNFSFNFQASHRNMILLR